jgi:hypothetical protein
MGLLERVTANGSQDQVKRSTALATILCLWDAERFDRCGHAGPLLEINQGLVRRGDELIVAESVDLDLEFDRPE